MTSSERLEGATNGEEACFPSDPVDSAISPFTRPRDARPQSRPQPVFDLADYASRYFAASRQAQGLPVNVEDAATLELVMTLVPALDLAA